MARFLILCDGNETYGYGHLRRSETLGAALIARGHEVTVQKAPDASMIAADLVVLDLPYNGDVLLDSARQNGMKVAGLDFVGDSSPDLVVELWDRGSCSRAGKRLRGLSFAMIRQDVRALRQSTANGNNVVVMIGGADVRGESSAVATLLAQGGQAVTLIDGPMAPIRTTPLPQGVTVLRTPSNLADIMAACGWAVTNGGSTMMEMLCLGKAVHVVPQTAAEQGFAEGIAAQGLLLGVGLGGLSIPTIQKIAETGGRAALAVDGDGVSRLAEALEDML